MLGRIPDPSSRWDIALSCFYDVREHFYLPLSASLEYRYNQTCFQSS